MTTKKITKEFINIKISQYRRVRENIKLINATNHFIVVVVCYKLVFLLTEFECMLCCKNNFIYVCLNVTIKNAHTSVLL